MGCGCGSASRRSGAIDRAAAVMLLATRADLSIPIADQPQRVLRCLPDSAGVVRWLGVRWYGVPKPIRLLWSNPDVREALGLPALSAPLYGCGCVVLMKDAWIRAKAAFR